MSSAEIFILFYEESIKTCEIQLEIHKIQESASKQ